MKRIVLLLACVFLSSVVFAQYTIIQTGRPLDPMSTNIKNIAAQKFKISYQYVAFNNQPEQLDSISNLNKITFQKIAKKYGEDWRKLLSDQEKEERSNVSLFQSLLIKEGKATSSNLFVYSKSKCGKNYSVEIYPDNNMPQEEQLIKARAKMKIKGGKAVIY